MHIHNICPNLQCTYEEYCKRNRNEDIVVIVVNTIINRLVAVRYLTFGAVFVEHCNSYTDIQINNAVNGTTSNYCLDTDKQHANVKHVVQTLKHSCVHGRSWKVMLKFWEFSIIGR